MTAPIRGLSLIQPWAHLVAHGPKRIENRTWAPPAAAIGGYLAIHASKRFDWESWEGALDTQAFRCIGPLPVLDGLPHEDDEAYETRRRREYCARACAHGAVVAVARLVGHVTRSDDPWFCGPIGWQLADVVPVEPVPCRGAQGLWELPPDVLATVRERYRAAVETRPYAPREGGWR